MEPQGKPQGSRASLAGRRVKKDVGGREMKKEGGEAMNVVEKDRLERQLTQAEYAEYLGISKPVLSKIERGDRVSRLTIARIAEVTKIPLEILRGDWIMILSASRIRCYKNAGASILFHTSKGLVPVETSAALEIGSAFHDHLERIIVEEGKAKIEPYDVPSAMAWCGKTGYIRNLSLTRKPLKKPFEYQIGKHTIIGRYDALT